MPRCLILDDAGFFGGEWLDTVGAAGCRGKLGDVPPLRESGRCRRRPSAEGWAFSGALLFEGFSVD